MRIKKISCNTSIISWRKNNNKSITVSGTEKTAKKKLNLKKPANKYFHLNLYRLFHIQHRPKVSPQDFLPVWAAPLPKIPIRSFWQWCDQMGEIRGFWPGESISLQNFTSVVTKVSLQNFLPILATPRPKITNWSFWPSCDQIVLLTVVRPKSMFVFLTVVGPGKDRAFDRCATKIYVPLFDHCATRKGLKNPQLMAG